MPLTAITDPQEITLQIQRFREILRGGPISPDELCWPVGTTDVRAETRTEAGDPVTTFLIDNQTIVQFRMRAANPDGNVTGALAVDETGATWLIHRGVISAPRTRAGFFESRYGRRRTDVEFPGRGRRPWYLIGKLDDPDFIEALCGYVQVCARVKRDGEDVVGPNQHIRRAVLPGNRPPSVIPPRPASTRDCVEENITFQLCSALGERGVTAWPESSQAFCCDLLADQPCEMIFEVKSGIDPYDYYCAIGQLLSYRFILRRPRAQLVAVLARNAGTPFTGALVGMGIELLEFSRTGSGTYEFEDLTGLLERLGQPQM